MTRKFTFLLMALLALAGFKSWGQTTILSENFEHGGLFPEGWTATHNNANGTGWYLAGTDDNIGSGYSGWSAFCKGASYSGPEDYLTTYAIDFSNYSFASLSFYYINSIWGVDKNHIRVEYSSSTDGSWTTLWSNTTETGGYNSWTAANNIDLSALCGGTYYLRFVDVDKYGYGVAIDDIVITGFSGTPYNIAYDNSNIQHGSISGPATAFAGQTVTLTATPAENYTLDHFTVDGLAIQGKTFTMPEHDVTVSAIFKQVFTLTVNDGTNFAEGGHRVPFKAEYASNYYTKSEFIIPLGDLEAMRGGTISSLTFYTSNYTNDYDFPNASWDVYVMEADYTLPGGPLSQDGTKFTDVASMTKVYSGPMSVKNHQMTIVLDAPIVYNSKNLIISFQQTSKSNSYSYVNVQWYGKNEGSAYRSRGGSYNDSNFTSVFDVASKPFLPKTTFTYTPGSTTEYTVNLHVNGVVTEETITSMPAAPTAPAGLTFCGWTTSDITTYVTDAPTYVTSLSDEITDLYAVFKYSEFVLSENATWVKMNNASDLNAGDEIVLVYNNLIMCTRGDAGWEDYPVADVTISNSEITYLPENAAQFTLIANNGYWNLQYNELGATRILATNSYNNELAPKDLYESWYPTYMSIDFTATTNGNSVLFYNSDTYMYIHYRSDWSQITTSNGSSTTNACQAYKKYNPVITTNYYMTSVLTGGTVANATFKNIIVVNPITVSGRLEMNANGLFRNENVANFVFADGAQFYYTGTENVKATFKKEIEAYQEATGNDGYYLIANPTNETTVTNLASNNYDLYTFNPAGDGNGNEWINMKNLSMDVANGTGYLYANSGDVTLQFAGALTPAGSTVIELTYADAGEGIDFRGFNLIGNPYACNAYVGEPFYVIQGTELTLSENAYVAPCEGFFVEATAADQSVTLSTTAPEAPTNMMSLSVSQNRGNVIDRAIVRFDGANDLHKFMLNPQRTNIRLAKNGEEFAAISSENEGEIPVSFKAEKNGSYTITVNTENVEANYLHLIDNLTGMDTDLLNTPSYTFNASTSDYAYRFKLVFSMTDVEENESNANSFAYISNGNLVINNIEGEATMQIVDMLGRVVSTEIVSGSYNKALNLKAGLYIINLNGMTQKIVVK